MRWIRHLPVREQSKILNARLRGHYNYYGVAGNIQCLRRLYRIVERYWRMMLSSRSRHGYLRWDAYRRIIAQHPLQQPKLRVPYGKLRALVVL